MSEKLVGVSMAFLALAVIAWDVYLWKDKRKGNTISERMRAWDNAMPLFRSIIIFGFGMLIGHWFWMVPLFFGQ